MFNLFKHKNKPQITKDEPKISNPELTKQPVQTPVIQPPYSLPINQSQDSSIYTSLHINSSIKVVDTEQKSSFDLWILSENKVFKELIRGDNLSSLPYFNQFLDRFEFGETGMLKDGRYRSSLISNTVVMNQDQSLTIKDENLALQSLEGDKGYFNINFLKNMFNLNNLYTEPVISDDFLTYINNNLIRIEDTKLNLNNMLVYLFILNSSITVNSESEVIISYYPTAEREYLIGESLKDYQKFFVLNSTLLQLTDNEILDLTYIRETKLVDETFREDFENTFLELFRKKLDYLKPDLELLSHQTALLSYKFKPDCSNPKLTFSLNYYKFLSYRMFVRYLNFLSSQKDFKRIKTFLSIVALNKETEDKINKILDKLTESVLEGKKPSDKGLISTLEAINSHFDNYFKPFDEEMVRLNSIFTKPSKEMQDVDNELADLVKSLED